jgi:hypothetical protein
MSKAFISSLCLALLASVSLLTGSAMAADHPAYAFYMENTSNKTLHFQYYCDGSPDDKTTEELDSKDSNWFWFDTPCKEYTVVKSTTNSDGDTTASFTYTVDGGHKYEIFWNDSQSAWDIQEQ